MTGTTEDRFPFDPGSKWNLIGRKMEYIGKNYTFNSISFEIIEVFSINLEDIHNDFKDDHVTWIQWFIVWIFLFCVKDSIFLLDSEFFEDDWGTTGEEVCNQSKLSLKYLGRDSTFESVEPKRIRLSARDIDGLNKIVRNSVKAGTHFAPQYNGYINCVGTNVIVKSSYRLVFFFLVLLRFFSFVDLISIIVKFLDFPRHRPRFHCASRLLISSAIIHLATFYVLQAPP